MRIQNLFTKKRMSEIINAQRESILERDLRLIRAEMANIKYHNKAKNLSNDLTLIYSLLCGENITDEIKEVLNNRIDSLLSDYCSFTKQDKDQTKNGLSINDYLSIRKFAALGLCNNHSCINDLPENNDFDEERNF